MPGKSQLHYKPDLWLIRAEHRKQEEPAPVLPSSLLHQTVLTRDGDEPHKIPNKAPHSQASCQHIRTSKACLHTRQTERQQNCTRTMA